MKLAASNAGQMSCLIIPVFYQNHPLQPPFYRLATLETTFQAGDPPSTGKKLLTRVV
jgi:hypothetical protein